MIAMMPSLPSGELWSASERAKPPADGTVARQRHSQRLNGARAHPLRETGVMMPSEVTHARMTTRAPAGRLRSCQKARSTLQLIMTGELAKHLAARGLARSCVDELTLTGLWLAVLQGSRPAAAQQRQQCPRRRASSTLPPPQTSGCGGIAMTAAHSRQGPSSACQCAHRVSRSTYTTTPATAVAPSTCMMVHHADRADQWLQQVQSCELRTCSLFLLRRAHFL